MEQIKMIKAIRLDPGKPAKMMLIENTLEALQQAVKGHIETVRVSADMIVICNEYGRLIDMEYNGEIAGIDFVGPILVVGLDGDEMVDVPETLEIFNKRWLRR